MKRSKSEEFAGADLYEQIKSSDQSPMFAEFIAAHEGVSTGGMHSPGGRSKSAPKRWTRERVAELARRLGPGTPVYSAHPGGNETRRPVGRVVSAAERPLGGRLAATCLAYIEDPAARDAVRSGKVDTCSIEAEVECHRDKGSKDGWVVGAVRKVTGLALGDSKTQRPGFPLASLVSAVQEFGDETVVVVGGADNHGAAAPESAPPRREASAAGETGRIRELERAVKRQNERIRELNLVLRDYRARERERSAGVAVQGAARQATGTGRPRLPAPPERKKGRDPIENNPLIPRPRGF